MLYISHLISVRLDIDRPLVCVSIFFSLLAKVAGNVSKYNGLHNSYSLQIAQNITTQR